MIRKAWKTIEDGGPERGIINRLAAFLDCAELNDALATDDRDEQLDNLVRLMLEGPYRRDAVTP